MPVLLFQLVINSVSYFFFLLRAYCIIGTCLYVHCLFSEQEISFNPYMLLGVVIPVLQVRTLRLRKI